MVFKRKKIIIKPHIRQLYHNVTICEISPRYAVDNYLIRETLLSHFINTEIARIYYYYFINQVRNNLATVPEIINLMREHCQRRLKLIVLFVFVESFVVQSPIAT